MVAVRNLIGKRGNQVYFSEILNSSNQYAYTEELDWIRDFASEVDMSPSAPIYNYVMLGAGPGVFAVALAEGNKLIPIEIVDNNTTHWVQQHLMALNSFNEILYVISDSAVRGKSYRGRPIDLLIVDAAHDEVSVTKDIQAWTPHVRIGGHIFFHDYLEREGGFNGLGKWEPYGVARAVWKNLNLDYWKWVDDVGISRIYRKVK
jgi:hypothetical protein